MTDEEMVKKYRKSLRQMTDSLYHKQLEKIKLESMSTTDLVDMLRERDKRIEELEKHNEEIIALIHAERERQEKCDDVHLRKIADLEKENAEMKETVIKMNNVITETFNNLTEAKAIIKDYMIIAKADHCEVCSVPEENRCINVLKLNEQVEQFLKEE